jgi:hypothetical protein
VALSSYFPAWKPFLKSGCAGRCPTSGRICNRSPTLAAGSRRRRCRKRLPSTTLGLLVHAAEHSARHAGQIVTLAIVVRD